MTARLLLFAVVVGSAAHAQGGLSKDVISEVILKHKNEVKFCFEQRLNANPQLAGKVAVAFWIESSGSIVEATIEEDTLEDPQVGSCIVQRVKRWKFPQPEGGGRVAVTFPWIFRPAHTGDDEPAPAPPEKLATPEPPEDPPDPLAFERWRESQPNDLGAFWSRGGSMMYPIALGLVFGLAAGFLALVLVFAGSRRPAAIVAGLCLGSGGFAFAIGWLGFVNGLMAVNQAVANVNPHDKEVILRAGEWEAAVCWQFGTIAAVCCAVLGAVAMVLCLRRKAVSQ